LKYQTYPAFSALLLQVLTNNAQFESQTLPLFSLGEFLKYQQCNIHLLFTTVINIINLLIDITQIEVFGL